MQASTARACLRKLSDCVNSVSKHQAEARSFMGSYLFSPVFRGFVLVFVVLFLVSSQKFIDIHRHCAPDYLQVWSLTTGPAECLRSVSSQTLMDTTLAPVDSREVVRC